MWAEPISAPIDEMNVVRRHLSGVKGGRLASATYPARLITHRFPFTDVQRAFETYRDRRDGALKVVLDF